MKHAGDESLTLFASGVPESQASKGYPYSLAVELLERSGDTRFPEHEISIFSHILEHEASLYEQRGRVAGPLTVCMSGEQALDLSTDNQPFILPSWVEEDGLQLVSCNARGVLLVESEYVFHALCERAAWRRSRLVLATGCGMPRAPMRRVLHRIQRRFGMPVYVLADNDTWGYFLFSMLYRGALAPDVRAPFLAISDLRYLGLRARPKHPPQGQALIERPWKKCWDLRLKSLRQYDCFRSQAWQAELDAFERQECAKSLTAFLDGLGSQSILEIVDSAISDKDWLA